jgi:hypothetical protein
MGYKVSVSGHFSARKVQVGDRMLPERYELHAEPNDDELRPGLTMVFEVIGGVPQCRELRLVSSEHGREVLRTDLRVPVEDHLEYATLAVAQPVRYTERKDGSFVMELDPAGLDVFRGIVQSARRTTRRRGPTDAELLEVAKAYQAADRAPTAAVAEKYGIGHRTASLWVSKARKLGYL